MECLKLDQMALSAPLKMLRVDCPLDGSVARIIWEGLIMWITTRGLPVGKDLRALAPLRRRETNGKPLQRLNAKGIRIEHFQRTALGPILLAFNRDRMAARAQMLYQC
jgi:hypothetical protein